MGAHLLRRIALIKAWEEWQSSRLVQHATRKFDAVTTAGFDRFDLASSVRNNLKRAPEARGQHEPRLAARPRHSRPARGTQRLVLPLGLTCVVPSTTWEHPPASGLDSKISLVTAKPFPADKTSNQDCNKARRHGCINEQAGYRSQWVDPLSIKHQPTHTTNSDEAARRACLFDSPDEEVLATVKEFGGHDDRAGKRVWSEVNSLLVDLTFTLFLLDCSASTPSPSHPFCQSNFEIWVIGQV
jgi:hypothetical protein